MAFLLEKGVEKQYIPLINDYLLISGSFRIR